MHFIMLIQINLPVKPSCSSSNSGGITDVNGEVVVFIPNRGELDPKEKLVEEI